jgi:hypothetical protein
MGWDGYGSGVMDSGDGVKQTFAGDPIAMTRRTGVADGSKQPFHIRSRSTRIEKS